MLGLGKAGLTQSTLLKEKGTLVPFFIIGFAMSLKRKDFSSKKKAQMAVEKAGLLKYTHTIQMNRNCSFFRFEPIFIVKDDADIELIKKFGFTVHKGLNHFD